MSTTALKEEVTDVTRPSDGRKSASPEATVTGLDAIFRPNNVAVIGASQTPSTVGHTLLWNLIHHPFGGTVFPVNPKRESVLGIKAYKDISLVPAQVDLVVIATPAPTVPGIIRDCAAAGVGGAIIISAGFKEVGEAGHKLEQEIVEQARGKIRIIGPNCLGVMNPLTGLNATFAGQIARPGHVAFISQSGALCTAILDWSLQENVGFSAFLSIGSMLDVGWGDLIDYLGNDPHTHSILLYMETIGDARSFLSAAREVALDKPIIVIKPGRTEAAAKAAASHTGSLAGSDEALHAAFRRSGVLRVDQIAELFYMAEVLAKQPRPRGRRLAILTNAGGPGVLATDGLITHGGQLADLSPATIESLNQLLPMHWSHGNPVDILGDAGPERYAKAVEILSKDPNSDGLLVVLTPQAMTAPGLTAKELAPYATATGKPILASWMGARLVSEGEAILNAAGIPTFPYPDTAARVFQFMYRYSENLRALYETPEPIDRSADGHRSRKCAAEIIARARQQNRTLLTEVESKRLLALYGIPTVETHVAKTPAAAVTAATALGYPVVLKLHSETITHKTDVGGVQLNLANATAVRRAFQAIHAAVSDKAGAEHFLGVTVQPMIKRTGYELIIGSSTDPQLGPVLLFGSGGQLVEVYKDRALGLPPLNTTLARRMMERTQIYQALQGVRGRQAVNLPDLERLLVRFSQLVSDQRAIKEIDVNPLLAIVDPAHDQQPAFLALDARVVLHGPDVNELDLPKLAIRPYPSQYVDQWTMKNGKRVTIRPICPEDEPLMIKFHESLSEQTVYQRYFHMISLGQRSAHERLARICFNDYDREIALVVEHKFSDDHREILAVGRLRKEARGRDAEFAILVSDKHQKQGLGSQLLERLILIGRLENVSRITASILTDNLGMKRICEKLGFHVWWSAQDEIVKAELDL